MKKILLITLLTLSLTSTVFADDFGHEGVNDDTVTLEDMLVYALEDEILAYTTYDEIVKAFDTTKPFTNIMRAELTHIDMIKDLMTAYGYALPEVDALAHVTLPESLEDAYKAGVQAEIDNILLYEQFLDETTVPDDVRVVFDYLISSSEKHLSAFERQVERNGFSSNRGSQNTFTKGNSSMRDHRNK